MKPRSYFLLGVVSGAAVLIVGWATRTNDCLQTSPSWAAWFDFIVGAFSIAAIFASIIAWGRAQGRQGISIVLIVQATLGAGIWGVVGFITLFMIVVPNGCLDWQDEEDQATGCVSGGQEQDADGGIDDGRDIEVPHELPLADVVSQSRTLLNSNRAG